MTKNLRIGPTKQDNSQPYIDKIEYEKSAHKEVQQ